VSLLEIPSSVLICSPYRDSRYAFRRAGEDHPDVQGKLGCTRLVMAPQPQLDKNGTLQADVDIPANEIGTIGLRRPSVLMMMVVVVVVVLFVAKIHCKMYQIAYLNFKIFRDYKPGPASMWLLTIIHRFSQL